MKIRKSLNCKSSRLEPEIIKLLNQKILKSTISKQLKISIPTIVKVAKDNGIIADDKVASCKLRRKIERDKSIYEMLINDEKLEDIANKFNISKQRIFQIADSFNYKRRKIRKNKNEILASRIKKDIKSGISFENIKIKYCLNTQQLYTLSSSYNLPKKLFSYCNKKRNKRILSQYKLNPAKKVLSLNEDEFSKDLNGITTTGYIYDICVQNGYYKCPKLKNRRNGGIFEDYKILKLINNLREKEKLSFGKIALFLNEKKYKTISGKQFSRANTTAKYHISKNISVTKSH